MPHNCNFDKTNLLVQIKSIMWRLDQYKKDAKKAGHTECEKLYEELHEDLHKYAKKLEAAIVGLAKEGKYEFCKAC